jgi:hypothetical protein
MWKRRVYAGQDSRNRPTYLSPNCTCTRRHAQSALGKLVADVERRQLTTNHGGSVGDLARAPEDESEPWSAEPGSWPNMPLGRAKPGRAALAQCPASSGDRPGRKRPVLPRGRP